LDIDPECRLFSDQSFGEYARDLDFPRHRQIFSKAALATVLEQVGYCIRFMPAPRIDTIVYFVACAKNVMAAELDSVRKETVLAASGLRMLLNVVLTNARRMKYAHEIVAIAKVRGTEVLI